MKRLVKPSLKTVSHVKVKLYDGETSGNGCTNSTTCVGGGSNCTNSKTC